MKQCKECGEHIPNHVKDRLCADCTRRGCPTKGCGYVTTANDYGTCPDHGLYITRSSRKDQQ